MARVGSVGPTGAITTGIAFGIPPILKFGSYELQERFIPDLLLGKKRICIAITEPGAGSDVSNISTTATRSEDGKYFIVNGTKKWFRSADFLLFSPTLTSQQDHKWVVVALRIDGSSYRRPRANRTLHARGPTPQYPWRHDATHQSRWPKCCRNHVHRARRCESPRRESDRPRRDGDEIRCLPSSPSTPPHSPSPNA